MNNNHISIRQSSKMECGGSYLPLEWEEKWRREKERLKRAVEEGGEGAERNKQELKQIVAYNDSKMGLSNARRTRAGPEPVHQDQASDEKTLDYSIRNYPCDIFGILDNFRKTGILTDLNLILENGQNYLVHRAVLAAVSASVLPSLNEENVESVIAAARVMEMHRLLEVCGKKTSGQQDGGRAEELEKTLEEMERLRRGQEGCDVALDVSGVFYHGEWRKDL
uniref:BTB domain-containing protein n=1 Tax=Periophthalmus magnuspinnatus TaxID=409849 RepID=A0A3B3ZL89_9GOBI